MDGGGGSKAAAAPLPAAGRESLCEAPMMELVIGNFRNFRNLFLDMTHPMKVRTQLRSPAPAGLPPVVKETVV